MVEEQLRDPAIGSCCDDCDGDGPEACNTSSCDCSEANHSIRNECQDDCCTKEKQERSEGHTHHGQDNITEKNSPAEGCCGGGDQDCCTDPSDQLPVGCGASCCNDNVEQSTAEECADSCCNGTDNNACEKKPQDTAECSQGCCDDDKNVSEDTHRHDTATGTQDDCCAPQPDEDYLEKPCDCCMLVTLQDAGLLPVTEVLPSTDKCCPPSSGVARDPRDSLIEHLRVRLATFKRCCAMLEDCCRKTCCLLAVPPPKMHQEMKSRLSMKITSPKKASPQVFVGDRLVVNIRGMDCPACTSKVGKAMAAVPTVMLKSVDYFKGKAELYHDPEVISADAIVKFGSRTTGFKFSLPPNSQAKQTTSSTARAFIPIRFGVSPTPEALAAAGTRVESGVGNSFELSYDATTTGARDIIKTLEQYAPELIGVDEGADKTDGARADFLAIILRTCIAAICTIPILVFAWAPLDQRPILYGAISLALATIIQIVAFPIISGAFRTLVFLRTLDIDLLIAFSTLTAYIFSVVVYALEVAGRPISDSFFETSALLVTLIYVGRAVQAGARSKTSSALRELQKLQTSEVLLVDGPGPEYTTRTIDARLLQHGDIIRVEPDTRVTTDGEVVRGVSEVDESAITGESLPMPKKRKSIVTAGTLNLNGRLDVLISKLPHENSLTSIAHLVETVQSSRSPIQDVGDKIASYILPVALAASAISFFVWVMVNIFIRNQLATPACIDALTYAIAVLVVMCPCAIGLAVPIVVAVAMEVGAKHGILFKSLSVLQTVRTVDTIVFDKTNTLTVGQLVVQDERVLYSGAENIIRTLLQSSQHPVARGVLQHVENTSKPVQTGSALDSALLSSVSSIPGKGMETYLGTLVLRAGNPAFAQVPNHPLVKRLQALNYSILCVSLSGTLLAIYGMSDNPRLEARGLVDVLKARGKNLYILSGDTSTVVQHVAQAVGIEPSHAISGHDPAQKQEFIRKLQADGLKVLFLGDGTNDSIAMSQADCSVAVSSATEVAVSSADVVLLRNDLRALLTLFDLANAALRRIYLNFFWCFLYNLAAVLLASGATVGARIEPRWAGLGELVSVFPIIVIGLALAWVEFE